MSAHPCARVPRPSQKLRRLSNELTDALAELTLTKRQLKDSQQEVERMKTQLREYVQEMQRAEELLLEKVIKFYHSHREGPVASGEG